LHVENITYRPPGADGSDHGSVLARLAFGSRGSARGKHAATANGDVVPRGAAPSQ
jgi:hypothetical protein